MVTGNSLFCGGYGLLEYDVCSLVDRCHYCQESAAASSGQNTPLR